MGWEIYPQGMTELLLWLQQRYTPPALLVTENGAAFDDTWDGASDEVLLIPSVEPTFAITSEPLEKPSIREYRCKAILPGRCWIFTNGWMDIANVLVSFTLTIQRNVASSKTAVAGMPT